MKNILAGHCTLYMFQVMKDKPGEIDLYLNWKYISKLLRIFTPTMGYYLN